MTPPPDPPNQETANKLEAQTTLEYLEQDRLDFAPDNPRFGGLMKGRGQQEIQKALIQEPYFASELIESLLQKGYIDYEPLVVRRKGDRFEVVEGNRRLAAIREILSDPAKYQGRTKDLECIPALVFPKGPTTSSNRK